MCIHLFALDSHSLDIENSVDGVHGGLVLRSLTDQTLLGGEGDERWGGEASLLVGDCGREKIVRCCPLSSLERAGYSMPHTDLNAGALIVGDARVGGSEIDTDRTVVSLHVGHDC